MMTLTQLDDRIAHLKRHIRSRRGRRDFQAHIRLVKLQDQFHRRSATSASFDRLLKNIYTCENIPKDRVYLFSTLVKK